MRKAAVQLGMDANPSIDLTRKCHTPAMEERTDTSVGLADTRKDYFIQRNGVRCAGSHLIVDLWGARRIDDLGYIEDTLRECIRAARDTQLESLPHIRLSARAMMGQLHTSESSDSAPCFFNFLPWPRARSTSAATPRTFDIVSTRGRLETDSPFGLIVNVTESADSIRWVIEHHGRFFEDSTIEQFSACLASMLERFADDPDGCIGPLIASPLIA